MSRSSSSRDRGATEATVALAAVLALSLGLSAYATVLTDGGDTTRSAQPALDRVHDAVTVTGVAAPSQLSSAVHSAMVGPDQVNATLTASGRQWHAGPVAPGELSRAEAAVATRRVGVELRPGRVRPGRLRVVVWR